MKTGHTLSVSVMEAAALVGVPTNTLKYRLRTRGLVRVVRQSPMRVSLLDVLDHIEALRVRDPRGRRSVTANLGRITA